MFVFSHTVKERESMSVSTKTTMDPTTVNPRTWMIFLVTHSVERDLPGECLLPMSWSGGNATVTHFFHLSFFLTTPHTHPPFYNVTENIILIIIIINSSMACLNLRFPTLSIVCSVVCLVGWFCFILKYSIWFCGEFCNFHVQSAYKIYWFRLKGMLTSYLIWGPIPL